MKCVQNIAWCGWSVPVPEGWRPLKIDGSWKKGAMLIGDGSNALLQVKWWHPRGKRFDGSKWVEKKAKEGRLRKIVAEPAALATAQRISCLVEEPVDKERMRKLWFVWSTEAWLAVEVVANPLAGIREFSAIEKHVVPNLRFYGKEAPSRLAIFSADFFVPAGYRLEKYRLNVGDLAFWARKTRKEAICIRQIHPARLALQRRKLERWLTDEPFTKKGKVSWNEPVVSEHNAICQGKRAIRAPLHFLYRRSLWAKLDWIKKQDRLKIIHWETAYKPEDMKECEFVDVNSNPHALPLLEKDDV